MLFTFAKEDSVRNLQDRTAVRVAVSANQFVLVFQSRTLVSAQRLVETVAQRRATVYMQGVFKGGMMRRGLMVEWDCSKCGVTRRAWSHCYGCGFKRDGSGVH